MAKEAQSPRKQQEALGLWGGEGEDVKMCQRGNSKNRGRSWRIRPPSVYRRWPRRVAWPLDIRQPAVFWGFVLPPGSH